MRTSGHGHPRAVQKRCSSGCSFSLPRCRAGCAGGGFRPPPSSERLRRAGQRLFVLNDIDLAGRSASSRPASYGGRLGGPCVVNARQRV